MKDIKFDEVLFPRYVKVKESIEDLMKIINFDEVKKDGIDRVLQAFLQLINENDDKTVEEKRVVIEDAIYNGNVFKHYFSEENQAKAVEILSNTALLNDEEKLIYIINFYMPKDVQFTNIYSECDKNIEKIAEQYGLTGEDANTFVYARVAEISKFYEMYRAEKERQKRLNETQVLAAMQDATDEPSKENIDKVKALLDGVTNLSLRETLEQQLSQLENDDYVEPGIEELEIDTIKAAESASAIQEDEVLEAIVETEKADDNTGVEEPELLEKVLEGDKVSQELPDKKVGEEVMASLQTLVAGARENARRVEQLSLDLEMRDGQIGELQATIAVKDEEIANKNQQLEIKETELQEKNKKIEERDEKIATLQTEVNTKNAALDDANKLVAAKDEEITSLNTSLNAYKASLAEIQSFLSSASPVIEAQENTRKVV